MIRGFFLAAAAALVASPVETHARPNILLLMTDDMRPEFPPFAGRSSGNEPHVLDGKMPNIEALMNGGTAFTQAFSQFPVCAPARAAIFTGRYATDTGVTQFARQFGDLDTFPKTLRQKYGYNRSLKVE